MNIESNALFATITVENDRDDILLLHILNVVNDEELQRFFPAIAGRIMNKSVAVNLNANLTGAELKEYDAVACLILRMVREFEKQTGQKEQHLPEFMPNELDLLFKFVRAQLKGHESKSKSIWRKFVAEVKKGDINHD